MEGRRGAGGSPGVYSGSPKKPVVEWVPLQMHPVFSTPRSSSSLPSGSSSSNLAAWDAASSRFYLWDPDARCLHRLSLRFRDPDPSSSAAAVVEAASPSEILVPAIQIQYVVHHISLNIDGSSLLLAGSNNVGLMYLYGGTSTNDHTVTCRTVLVGSQIFFGYNNGLQTLQASWHPYSNTHLGILSSDSVFRLFDLSSDLEKPEQEYYLQPVKPGRCHNAGSICPVAFSFGGQHLWDRFSVFVLFSDGSAYVLCPVVPFGSLCSWAYVEEIYEDVNTLGLKSSNSKDLSSSSLAIAWLEATFPELADRSLGGGNILILRAHPYAPLDASLSLQGPLAKVCHGEENDDSEAWSADCEGRAIDFLYNSIGKDSVLVIAWSSGQVQIDALADEVQPLWKVGSSPHLRVDSYGRIKGVAMICESNLQESFIVNVSQSLNQGSIINDSVVTVWSGHAPPLLRLAIIDLALPKYVLSNCLLSLFSDPLVSERFYCLHGGGIDLVAMHFLPFSNPIPGMDKIAKAPTVCPILSTSHSESCSPSLLCGFVTIADSFGHSQIVGITSSYNCIVLEMKSWDEILPLHYNMDVKSIGSTETDIPDIISRELLSGPRAISVPPTTTLRSLSVDSIEGRSTLHHYIKLFHENYVEYAHKVYIELKHHGDYLKIIMDDQHKRIREAKQLLENFEAKEAGVKDRILRAFEVYEHLEKRLQNLTTLPGAKKKPLSRAEREFKAQLDRFADVELGALHSSIEALTARLRRYMQSSPANPPRRTLGRRNHVPEGQISQLKSSLGMLSSINDENTNMLKLIENELKSMDI